MDDLYSRIEEQIPRLRRYAVALTRDPSRADDLVQDCLARAISKVHLWREGTNMRAWLFTILHNEYVNQVRTGVSEGSKVEISAPGLKLSTAPTQESPLALRDLERALAKLPEEQRQVLLFVGLEGMSYEEIAVVMNVPIGTIRSRLSRGRDALRILMGEALADRDAERQPRRQRAPARVQPPHLSVVQTNAQPADLALASQ